MPAWLVLGPLWWSLPPAAPYEPPPPLPAVVRLVDAPDFHVGVRPAADFAASGAPSWGLTVQFSTSRVP